MRGVLEELLAATGGHAAEAGAADAVAGVPARYVAAPGSTDEVAAVLRVAAAHGLATVARGAGTKLDWGTPPRRLDLVLDTARLDRVVEHAAGDLVVTVQAGVPLAALANRLATARQRLAVDEVVPGSTVGGVLATGLSGPRRLLTGAVRDLVLGVTLVRADGVVAHAGSKVVKNVAGYDLARLACGAYGTLGLVTEATFRLHPVPEAAAYVTARYPDPATAYAAVQQVLHGQFVPSAVEVDRPDPAGPVEVAVLVEGTAAGVAARTARAAAAVGGAVSERPDWWGRLPAGEVLVKVTTELTGLARLLDAVAGAGPTTNPGPATSNGPATSTGPVTVGGPATRTGPATSTGPVTVRGSAGSGALHVGLPAEVAAEVVAALRAAAPAWGGSVVVLVAPPAVRAAVDSWGPVPGLELMRRVKDRFDPGALLAPGRFVGGI